MTMPRPTSPALEALLGVPIGVLDHGHVVPVDYMGTDQSVVDAARISYGAGTKKLRENDGLIHYLMRHRHTSPFEACEIRFVVKMPIFVARQWVRHRTANINEESARYSVLKDEFYLPYVDRFVGQDSKNKQGGTNEILTSAELLREEMRIDAEQLMGAYGEYLNAGLVREVARINLPLSTYTSMAWKIDLHNLFHFLKLRNDSHAQWEIVQYAEAIEEIVKAWVPVSYAAWVKYVKESVTLTREEYEALRLRPSIPAS